jgi:hypothetical protein
MATRAFGPLRHAVPRCAALGALQAEPNLRLRIGLPQFVRHNLQEVLRQIGGPFDASLEQRRPRFALRHGVVRSIVQDA